MVGFAEKHIAFYRAVESFQASLKHLGRAHRGHGFDHDIMVAGFALQIAESERVAELTWLAALLHSIDRHVDATKVETTVRMVLDHAQGLSNEETELVWDAVRDHNKKNDDNDGPVTITLKDADRLANIGPSIIIRCGQFQPELPPFEFAYVDKQDPASTYREPRSVLDDIRSSLEWRTWFRLPKAKLLAEPYLGFLDLFFALNSKHVHDAGL